MISQAPIFTIHAELADIRHFGTTPYGERRVVDILGGRVEGPRLQGRILPRADWQIVRPDGVTDLEALRDRDRSRHARPRAQRRAAPWPARGDRRARPRRGGRTFALLLPHRDAVRDRRPSAGLAQPDSGARNRRAREARGPARRLRGGVSA